MRSVSNHIMFTAKTAVQLHIKLKVLYCCLALSTKMSVFLGISLTELYYITGGPARDQKVSQKTWRILRHFHDNTYFIFMVTATDQPRS